MINVEHLTKFYGKNLAVKNISFTINPNEILGFLGPNGAGKSTTMNMISGYLPMSSGKVTIYGADIVTDSVKAKKNIGYLPELPPVYPDMKVHEYLKFCTELKQIPKKQRKEQIEKSMEHLNITDMSNRLIKNLSKGYKQRVGFAQAILGDPKFLILDEPTVGLDPEQVIEVRQIIKDLKKDHSVIFSSHILSEVSAVCDKIAIINKGEIKIIDTIENLNAKSGAAPTLILKAKGDLAKATTIINSLKGVKNCALLDRVDDNIGTFKIAVENNIDEIKSNIVAAIVTGNIQFLEIYAEKHDLEELFVKLVNQSTKRQSLKDMVEEMNTNTSSDNGEDN